MNRTPWLLLSLLLTLCLAGAASAHFGMVIPDQNIVSAQGNRNLNFNLMFWHPMEMKGMNLAEPDDFGVFGNGKKTSLKKYLKADKIGKFQIWRAAYRLSRPGDLWFYMAPKPYWEPEEDSFIIHYTKTIVSAFGKEEGWGAPVGLPIEIIPLTRPYGLFAGNSFTGQVIYKGKPLAGCDVEVEFFNRDESKKAPTASHLTQVVKTDKNGVFTYAMPWAGWWGFAALTTSGQKMKKDGQDKNVELGGVLWIKTDK